MPVSQDPQSRALSQAQSLQGSVFDDWREKLIRAMGADPAGAAGGMGIVMNPEHWAARATQAAYPKVYEAMDRIPQQFMFGGTTRPGQRGVTQAMVDTQTKMPRGPIKVLYNREGADATTLAHEPLHALYTARGAAGRPPSGYAELIDQANRMRLSPQWAETAALEGGPDDPGHRAVAGMAIRMAQRMGYAPR